MNIRIIRIAAAETRLIVVSYNLERQGLGLEFHDELDGLLRGIAEHPKRWPLYHHNVRRALLNRFPYVLYYDLPPDAIRVLRVVHAHRDPESIKNLLPNSPPR